VAEGSLAEHGGILAAPRHPRRNIVLAAFAAALLAAAAVAAVAAVTGRHDGWQITQRIATLTDPGQLPRRALAGLR
jgi:hypothetical protein